MKKSPKSIFIFNQPWSNHGDEAAHKALLRMLGRRFPKASISVLVFEDKIGEHELEIFRPDDVTSLEYRLMKTRPPGDRLRWASRLSPKLMMMMLLVSPGFRKILRWMRDADLIVSAPSGADLGPYRNWRYLALLLLAAESETPTAVYSISFGPLPEDDPADARFSKLTVGVLERSDFLSLRETASQQLAERLGIRHVVATDTAFTDATRVVVPESLRQTLAPSYVLVVPNELHRWHVAYSSCSAQTFDDLYCALIETALRNTDQVVLMPQLFGRQNDSRYCDALRERFSSLDRERIVVLPEQLSKEVQEAVIADAEMVIGARCHSIVFSIRNTTPFLALSYEPKIRALLEQAGLDEYMVDLEELETVDTALVERLFEDIYSRRFEVRQEIAEKATALVAIAESTEEAFVAQFGGSEE
jgi:colanic acid/amylovoran biosynthesis protein